MGDIADEHYDRMVDEGHLFSGNSWATPRCNRCGSRDVYWENKVGPKPYLAMWGSGGLRHTCPIRIDDMPNLENE